MLAAVHLVLFMTTQCGSTSSMSLPPVLYESFNLNTPLSGLVQRTSRPSPCLFETFGIPAADSASWAERIPKANRDWSLMSLAYIIYKPSLAALFILGFSIIRSLNFIDIVDMSKTWFHFEL